MPLRLHPCFSEHAVLQRGHPLPIWGWAEPSARVEVVLDGDAAASTADAAGRWEVLLPARPAGGPLGLVVSSGAERIERRDLLVGDVFLASGQSNMEWSVVQSDGGAEAIARAGDDRDIRCFHVPMRPASEAQAWVDSQWRLPSPHAIQGFSAVAWFAALRLRRERRVPVGLIHCAWGGTPIEPWISPRGGLLHAGWRSAWSAMQARLAAGPADPAEREALRRRALQTIVAPFQAWRDGILARDGGEAAGWHRAETPIADGAPCELPGYWSGHDGVRWFASEVDLPPGADAGPGLLSLGSVDNEDSTWWDGELLGSTGYLDGPNHWQDLRRYAMAPHQLRPGRHRIVVRVLNYGGRGGFGPDPDGAGIACASGLVPLPARWRWRNGAVLAGPPPAYPPEAVELKQQSQPGVLFNGMIAPLLPFPLAGVWWYQGESNEAQGLAYADLLRLLIQDWRAWWRRPEAGADLPFHVVQLTSFRAESADPAAPSGWAAIRAAQEEAATLPGASLTVSYDLGDAADIHPRAKRPVGERLALAVLGPAGTAEPISGPRVRSCRRAGGEAHLAFVALGGLRTRDGKAPRMIAIAGADGVWRWAETRIAGDTLIARHPAVPEPRQLRHAWADNLLAANLTDASGLPAWPWSGPVGG